MLGLSKNKKESAEAAADNMSGGEGELKEEQFTVMPPQYTAASAAAAPVGSRKIYLIVGIAVFLLLIGGGAYFFFVYGSRSGGAGVAVAPPAGQPPSPTAENTATTTQPKVITAEARDKENNLLGALSLTIPAPLVDKYGQTIGITVINKDDLALPAGASTLGGLYSAYPLGVAFDEPISLLLSAVKLPPETAASDFVPAYLKGAEWQKLSVYQTAAEGWSLSLNQFPNGPITLIQSTVATSTAASDLATGTPEQIVASSDADHDGLTDKEEALFGTGAQNKDTDGDSYDDKQEIMNNYSPLAGQGEKLSTAALFKLYTNPQYGYQVFHPAKWLADSLDQTGTQVLFISDTDEFFEVLIEENSANLPIVDWYRSQSPALASVSLDVAALAGAAMVWSPDHLTLYAGKDGLVYIITYNRGNLAEINWPTAWEYFYKNFKFGNTSAGAGASNNNPATTTAATTGGTTGP